MNQDKVSKFIKKLRKENNLTQKQLADKYNITYQAVSKWENGINLPDTILLKQMSKDFNISLDEILDGEYNKSRKNNKKLYILIIIILIFLLSLISFVLISSKNNYNYEFKTIKSSCSEFKIKGSMAYNNSKSSIYISDISYCGNDYKEKYKNMKCILYEKDNNITKEVSSYIYEGDKISLEEFLKKVSFNVDNYSKLCKKFKNGDLYLEIQMSNDNKKNITHKIPLNFNSNCS